MRTRKVLLVTGSIGLGHVTRDLALAVAVRELIPEVELSWLGCETVRPLLEGAGEKLLSEATQMVDVNISAERAAQANFRLSLPKYLFHSREGWKKNASVFVQVVKEHNFDLVVGDEAYELVLAILHGQISVKPTFLSIYDFLGLEPMGHNPLERLACYLTVRRFVKVVPETVITYAYVGEEEDVLDSPWGFLLPNRREWARENCHFLGHIVRFDPKELSDKSKVRKELGYGSEHLVVCSIGGTAVGKELLELCGKAYPLVKSKIPDLRMILACGPRLAPKCLSIPEGVEIRGYVPDLYQHFAASDLAIVQAGGTTTTELMVLQKPFLYFPLEDHYEQQIYVAGMLERHKAGVRMCYPETTPESLAQAVLAHIGRSVEYPPIPIDGAQNAAKLISELLLRAR